MTAAIDITKEQRKTLLALLRRFVPGVAVWAYGSRVKWTARPNSDLDLVAFTTPAQSALVSELKEALAESDLPFLVDFHVWDEVPDRFHEIIRKEYVVLQEAEEKRLGGDVTAGWEMLTLGELGRIVTGKTPSTSNADNFGNDVPFVTPSDMDERKVISSTMRYLTEAGVTSVKGSRIPAGSVMVSCIGSDMGKAAVAGRDCVTNQQINSIVVDDRFSHEFVYYNLRTRKAELQHLASGGSTLPILNKGDFAKIEIMLPPLPEQKAIARVLGTLDDKIELNRRMNATLEAMARALFQSWFVDFDPVRAKLDGRQLAGLDVATAALFPAHFQDSPLGHIPQGWEVVFLDAISTVSSGKRPTGRNDTLTPECNIPLYGGGGRMGYVSTPLYEKPILFTGRVGTLGLIFRVTGTSWPSDNTLIVEPIDGFFDFTYFALQGFDLITLNRGSTQPLLTQTDLKRQQIVRPPENLVRAFARIASPIFEQIDTNEKQSRTLATLRDALLPKLISGELRVKQVEPETA